MVLREEGDPTPEVVDEEAAPVEAVDVVDFLLEERLTLVVRPLKQRDNSAAARFVKLTSADIPAPVEPVALFHAARQTTRKQARICFLIFRELLSFEDDDRIERASRFGCACLFVSLRPNSSRWKREMASAKKNEEEEAAGCSNLPSDSLSGICQAVTPHFASGSQFDEEDFSLMLLLCLSLMKSASSSRCCLHQHDA